MRVVVFSIIVIFALLIVSIICYFLFQKLWEELWLSTERLRFGIPFYFTDYLFVESTVKVDFFLLLGGRNMKKQDAIRDARALGTPKMLVLGLQHLFAMFGATVLVPILVNSFGLPLSIQTTLLMAGLGTLLFHFISKFKVPAFLGSSFAFLGGYAAVANLGSGKYAAMSAAEKLQYAGGGIVVAGLLYVVLALIVKFVGVKKVMRFLPPIVTGPIVIIIVTNIWGKGMIKITPILLGVVGSYIIALIANAFGATTASGDPLINFSAVSGSKVIGLQPFFTDFGGTICKFDITSILVMAPIAIASMMEHIGDISAISATVGENFIEDPGLNRTLVGDGLATSLSALFGGPANTTYGENTGVLVLSKVYDPRVVRLAALYAIVLSFSPAFAALINSMPTAIIGGISFILYGMISAIGVRNIVENRVDFSNSRNLIIGATILVCGLGFTDGITFTIGSAHITLTALAIASIVGIFLNAVLPGKDYEFGSDISGGSSGNLGTY